MDAVHIKNCVLAAFAAVGTVESIYWSYPVSWLLTFLIHLVYLERDRRRLLAEQKEGTDVSVV